ncbi:hypothetical protein BO82DRAFT_405930 [Aspergillus uvarum CBS 121591]|uniref:Uncharacterized protein n=1 Tax=Aspergillus uvarum CBS 121591 TaxID=1448315 RepID=A0A319BVD4_9EURO|nr:hypothetical protein BO82DRAFT_405930 [Aspergillus uvarum CBS 121591]PYH77666.1 hypothetical protein BO82DRAFT_405930 [Aspergillus uvarum CBS 121591]
MSSTSRVKAPMESPYEVIDPNGDVLLVLQEQAGRIYASLTIRVQHLNAKAEPVNILLCNLTDLNAVYILLNILHCRTRQVPRDLDLNLLCMVAGLA